jgi:hypothetical protein
MTDSERSRKHLLRALILGAALVVGLGMYCAAGSVASAASRARVVPGRGVWLAGHTDFVGYYRALVGGRWVKVYCVSPGRRAPTRISLRTVSRVPAKSAAITRQLAETLTAHGDARTAAQAEAVSQALNAEIGTCVNSPSGTSPKRAHVAARTRWSCTYQPTRFRGSRAPGR